MRSLTARIAGILHVFVVAVNWCIAETPADGAKSAGSDTTSSTQKIDTTRLKNERNFNQLLGIAIGANFDPVDGLAASSAYVVANAGDRFLIVESQSIGVGFESIMYRNRSVSGRDTTVSMASSYNGIVGDPSRLIKTDATETRINRRQFDNLGMGSFVTVSWRPIKQNFFGLLLGAEYRRQTISYHEETVRTTTTSSVINASEVAPGTKVEPRLDTVVNSWWYQLGFEFASIADNVSWRVQGFPKIWRDQDGGDGKQSYAYRFSLVEHAFGLEIGGEMRGAYKEPGTEYVIYLGKRFNFVKLLDFL
jgi:hypothetical protein